MTQTKSTRSKANPAAVSASLTTLPSGRITLRLPEALGRQIDVSFDPPRPTRYGMTDPEFRGVISVGEVQVAYASPGRARISLSPLSGQRLLWIGAGAWPVTETEAQALLDAFQVHGLEAPRRCHAFSARVSPLVTPGAELRPGEDPQALEAATDGDGAGLGRPHSRDQERPRR